MKIVNDDFEVIEVKELDDDLMCQIRFYMNDDIREELHIKLAPCSNNLFLEEYCKRDTSFKELLEHEFGISL